MTLARPSAVVTLDGQRLTSAEGAVVRIRMRLGLGPAHDDVEVFCWPSSKLKSAAPGSTLAIALGNAGSEVDVFTGEVSGVRLTPDSITLEGIAKTVALSRTFMSQTFLESTVGDVVKQLASAAGVSVGGASGDTNLSAFAVDNRRSAWAHLNDLANLIGADITSDGTGALKFVAPPAGGGGVGASIGGLLKDASKSVLAAAGVGGGAGANGALRYGANLLSWRATSHKAPDTASVAAYGSASESGSDKWHWIRADQSAVGTGPARIIAAFATRDGATALSNALNSRAARAKRRATVFVVGDPNLRPGQTTSLADVPGDAGGDLRIVAVEHTLDGDTGLVTRLVLEPAS